MNIKRDFSPWWLLAVILLVAIALLYAGGGYLRQLAIAREFREHVTSLRQSGYPVDVDSRLHNLVNSTSDENTVAWSKWMDVALEIHEAARSAEVFNFRNKLVIANPPSDKPWAEKPLIDTLVQQSKPAYERLKELSHQDGKVWLPTVFVTIDDASEPQYMLRAIHSFMLLHMMHAVYERHAEAATEAFSIHSAALDAFDWQGSIKIETQLNAMFEQRDAIMVGAIEQGLFDAKQLARLKQLVGQQSDIRERWRNVIAAERAIFIGRLRDLSEARRSSTRPPSDGRLSEASIPVSYRQQQLINMDSVMDVADEGIVGLQQRATVAVRAMNTIAERELANVSGRERGDAPEDVTPNVEEFARSLVGREASRKRTIEAIDRRAGEILSPQPAPRHEENSSTKQTATTIVP